MLQLRSNDKMPEWKSKLLLYMRLLVLAGALALVLMISADVFRHVSYFTDSLYIKIQLWICIYFIFNVIVEFTLSPKTLRYTIELIIFLIVSIPYLNIVDYLGIDLTGELRFLLRIVPMIRAAYVLALVNGNIRSDRFTGMLTAYLVLLVVVLYFGSLMFYVSEYDINPDITDYWQALWWAVMCMTTAGSYINEYTTVGRVLSVILSGGGLILFPVFTVYIAHAIGGFNQDSDKTAKSTGQN